MCHSLCFLKKYKASLNDPRKKKSCLTLSLIKIVLRGNTNQYHTFSWFSVRSHRTLKSDQNSLEILQIKIAAFASEVLSKRTNTDQEKES